MSKLICRSVFKDSELPGYNADAEFFEELGDHHKVCPNCDELFSYKDLIEREGSKDLKCSNCGKIHSV